MSKTSKQPGKLSAAMEDYLEAIFNLDREGKAIRVKNIAVRLGVKMPTVTSMLKILRDNGYVEYQRYEYVKLTAAGRRVGRDVVYRHETLLEFLTSVLHVEHDTADKEACKMEHVLSRSTLDSFRDFLNDM